MVCKDYVLCQKCFRGTGHKHRMQRKRVPDRCMPPEALKGQRFIPDRPKDGDGQKADLGEYVDEYFGMDYEDIIAGDIPCRFKYVGVAKQNYGMTTEVILKKTDSQLNQRIGLKRLAAYDDGSERRAKGKGKGGKGEGKGSAKGKGEGKGKGGKDGRQSWNAKEWKVWNTEGKARKKARESLGLDQNRLQAYGVGGKRPAEASAGASKKKHKKQK